MSSADDKYDIAKRLVKRFGETPVGSVLDQTYHTPFIGSRELNPKLVGPRRFVEFENMAMNCSIVNAGLHRIMDTLGASDWSFIPAPADEENGRFADLARRILMEDPITPFKKMVGQAAMFRFNGYCVMNPVLRRDDGYITLDRLENRPVRTIEKITTDSRGVVTGFEQRPFRTSGAVVFLPIDRMLYLVDDIIGGGPDGFGLYRGLYPLYEARKVLQDLFLLGVETDLTGVPKAFVPYQAIGERIKRDNDGISDEDVKKKLDEIFANLANFLANRRRMRDQYIMLDSTPYMGMGEDKRPIALRQSDIELMSLEATSFSNIQAEIKEYTRAITHILSIEEVLLAENTQGSHALAENQTEGFGLRLKNTLETVRDGFRDQILKVIWEMNGWSRDTMPRIDVELPIYVSPKEMAETLRILGVRPGDPAIDRVRGLMGLPPVPEELRTPEPEPEPNPEGND